MGTYCASLPTSFFSNVKISKWFWEILKSSSHYTRWSRIIQYSLFHRLHICMLVLLTVRTATVMRKKSTEMNRHFIRFEATIMNGYYVDSMCLNSRATCVHGLKSLYIIIMIDFIHIYCTISKYSWRKIHI